MDKSFNDYEKLSVATDVVILTTANKKQGNVRKVAEKGLQVLLIKRDEEPFNGKWSLPGGFVDADKGLEFCARTKLTQKTGITYIHMEQLYTYGDVDRDRRGRVISVAYMALARKADIDKKHGDKNSDWFWVDAERDRQGDVISVKLESESTGEVLKETAFDHTAMIVDALNRLSNKIEYTNLAFHLLEEKFTVRELQSVYEAVLGHEVQAFRRKMGDRIVETDEWVEGAAHRPARLYAFNTAKTNIF